MSVLISGALINGAGVPMAECKIYLDALVNTSEVVTESFAVIETDAAGQYAFEAQKGKYTVHIKQKNGPKCCVGDISVYNDSKPGTLNDFLTALDESDLKPDVVKRFEELAQQAQQSAEAAAESERQAGQHVADAQQIKSDCETLADNVQLNAIAVAEDKQRVEQLASEVELNAGQVQEGVQSVTDAVKQAKQAADDSASSAEESKNNADNAALSEQNAKSHADSAAEIAQQTAQDAEVTTTARDDAERFAGEAENSAQASGSARDESVDAAERAHQHKEAASSAATSAENAANVALGHENNAAEYARQAKASQDASAGNAQEAKQHRDEAQRIVDDLKGSNASTTEKGLVQLCSDTDNDSEELAATPKAVKTVMDETKTKAPLDSPAFTGTPTTPTPPDDAVGLETANAAFVRKLLAALVDSSPEALDTLNELAAALGNDPNFATTIMNALAGKQPLSDVLTAISNLEERADKLLCFNQDGNASLSPLSEKARSLLAQATVEAMRNELELKSAAVKDIQTDLYDSSEGRVALPGAFGYGMTKSGGDSIVASDMTTVARATHNKRPGRYYTFSTQTEETTGITEIIWLDNGWDDKTSQTATKLVLFFGKDGRILMTIRGNDIYAPVTWTNLTPQLGSA
ncbi:shikimate transporter, partial [Escherichia coli]|nr:shikimate transporter [Escherichia coli]